MRQLIFLLILLAPLSTLFAQDYYEDRSVLNVNIREGKNICRYKGYVNPSGPDEVMYVENWTHEAEIIIHIDNNDVPGKYLPNKCLNLGAVYIWVNEYSNWTLQHHNWIEKELVRKLTNRLADRPDHFAINIEYKNRRAMTDHLTDYYVLEIDLKKVNNYQSILGYK